jgi:putative nucleotidyltransferase with HDIG domain
MDPREFVRNLDQLESLPSVAVKAIELASSSTANFGDLVRVIESDPSLASRVIKVANSPWLGCPGDIDNLDRALALLGMEMVRTLSLSMLVTGLFIDNSNESAVDKAALWQHCLAGAIASEHIARKVGYTNPKVAFLAGLLHDIGKLIFLHWDHVRYEKVVEKARDEEVLLHPQEKEAFEVDHAELGYELPDP